MFGQLRIECGLSQPLHDRTGGFSIGLSFEQRNSLIQCVRYDSRLSFFAPIFFLVGMSVGTSGHYTGLFAFALVLAINPVIPNPRMFLTAYGALLLPLGFVFSASPELVGLNAGLVFLAPLASLLTKRPLVIFSRKPKGAASAKA